MAIVRVIPAGDLALDAAGDIVWLTGPEWIRRKLSSRLRFFLGEYFLDLRQGVPYYRHVLVKNPDLDRIRDIFRRVILGTPGVLSLDSLDLQYDPSTRRLSMAFFALVDGGEVTVSPGDQDFVIELD